MKIFELAKSVSQRGFFSGFIELPKDRSHWSVTLLFIVLAYLLSFWVRLEWIDFAQANYLNDSGEVEYLRPDMVKDGVALPNTHDSFYFGSILQKAHLGMHSENYLVPSEYKNGMITFLPYILLKIFPDLKIEQLLLWLPVCVAGFVCIPIVLIGRLYGSSLWGFLSACLAGITHSYYNRTLAGYYDTDMFSITAPAFAMYFLLAASRKESTGYLLAGTISLYLSGFFYGSVQAIICALALTFLVYRWGLFLLDFLTLSKKNKRTNWKDSLQFNSFDFACQATFFMAWVFFAESWALGSSVEYTPYNFLIGLLLPVVFYFVYKTFLDPKNQKKDHTSKFNISEKSDYENENFLKPSRSQKLFLGSTISLLLLLLVGVPPFLNFGPFSGTWNKLTGKLQSYSVISGEGGSQKVSPQKGYSLNFKDVQTTIREASEVPPDVVRNRILSDAPSCSCPRCLPPNEKDDSTIIPTAIIGFIGIGFLILRYWELCLTLPFCAIAYYCFQGSVGLRFTVHAGNVAALGLVFFLLVLLWYFARELTRRSSIIKKFDDYDFAKWVTWIITACIVLFFAFPNIKHAKNYNSHVVYPVNTIKVLDKLNEVSDPEDFVITWWDYGSGCWFYGDTKTFTSPAHQTFDNFLTSEILRSKSSLKAANLARLKTETFINLRKNKTYSQNTFPTAVQAMFKDGTDELEFYQGLLSDLDNTNYILPDKTCENFLFLPYEILRIFPTILSFSSRNLYFSENQLQPQMGTRDPPMLILKNGRREGSSIIFDGNFRMDKRGTLRMYGQQNGVIPYGQIFEVSNDGQPAKLIQSINFDGLIIPSNSDSLASRRLVFIKEFQELVVLSPETYRSEFARRFLLDQFDKKAYQHNQFAIGPYPVNQPYMTQADWVTQNGMILSLNMRGGYVIEANINNNLAKVPGVKDPVPFNFHRAIHQSDGSIIQASPKVTPDAKFHLIQSNLPVFLGGRTFEVPKGGMTLGELAKINGLNSKILEVSTGKEESYFFSEFEKVEIPAKGYQLLPAFFFMDDEIFKSVLIQGFFMDNLDPKYFSKVYSSAWGKVYKFLK